MAGKLRPWQIGILWNDDQRMSLPLLDSLRGDPDLCVGDNQPYDAREHVGYTIETHGGVNGFPHVLIEVRQDLIATEERSYGLGGSVGGAPGTDSRQR